MATLVQTPVFTVSEFNEAQFRLSQLNADPHALRWFLAHARIVPPAPAPPAPAPSPAPGPSPAPPPDVKPLVHFPTGQYDEVPEGTPISPNKRIEFENDMSPLRIKGEILNGRVTAEVGLTLHPAVYYKLGDLNGDLSKGPVTFNIPETTLYKGSITIQAPAPGNGLGGFLAHVDWYGLGVEVAKVVLPLLIKAPQA